jgi:hypothetical protein
VEKYCCPLVAGESVSTITKNVKKKLFKLLMTIEMKLAGMLLQKFDHGGD